MQSSKIGLIIVIVVVLLGVVAATYALQAKNDGKTKTSTLQTKTTRGSSNTPPKPATSVTNSPSTTNSTTGSSSHENTAHERILLSDRGFSRPMYHVGRGELVMVENRSTSLLQFSSDDHPSHLIAPTLNMTVLARGERGTFTAPKSPGNYGFHDHLHPEMTGTLLVE